VSAVPRYYPPETKDRCRFQSLQRQRMLLRTEANRSCLAYSLQELKPRQEHHLTCGLNADPKTENCQKDCPRPQ
jgi:hypothetical protein